MELSWADRLVFRESPEMELSWTDRIIFRESPEMELSWADRLVFRVSRNEAVLGRSPSVSLLPRVTSSVRPWKPFGG